jgi:adenylyl-sulfate kinase
VSDDSVPGAPAGTPPDADAGFVIWITGLSGSGKSTVSSILERRLRAQGYRVEILDGDVVRQHLTGDLGFSRPDRDANVRRIGWVCELLARNGVVAIASVISPYRAVREELRNRIGRFVEVYMEVPLEVVAARDVKGLYRRAQAGEIPNFTGVSDPYEPPLAPDVVCHSDGRETPEQSAAKVVRVLVDAGYVSAEHGDRPQG